MKRVVRVADDEPPILRAGGDSGPLVLDYATPLRRTGRMLVHRSSRPGRPGVDLTVLKVLACFLGTLVLLFAAGWLLLFFMLTRVHAQSAEGEQTAHALRGLFSYNSHHSGGAATQVIFWADFPVARERHESSGLHGDGESWMYGKLSPDDVQRLIAHLEDAGLEERVIPKWNLDPHRGAPNWWKPRAETVRSFVQRADGPYPLLPQYGGPGVVLVDETRGEVWVYFART